VSTIEGQHQGQFEHKSNYTKSSIYKLDARSWNTSLPMSMATHHALLQVSAKDRHLSRNNVECLIEKQQAGVHELAQKYRRCKRQIRGIWKIQSKLAQ
jgi:hypothetical protein